MPRLIHLFQPRRRNSAGLAGFLLLFVYVFAMWHWNRELAREEATRELQQKIVTWIDRQAPKHGGYAWDELSRALIVTQEDSDFLHQQGYEYRPIGPESQPDEILFLERKGPDEERFVCKDGSHGYERRWPSPDSKHVLLDQRASSGPSTRRMLRFIALGQPGDLGEYIVDGYQRPVFWNSIGDLVVVKATPIESEQPFVIFRLINGTVEVVEWPAELTLANVLAREAPHKDTQWGMEFFDPRGWQGPKTLLVYLQGNGSYRDPASGVKKGFNLIYDALLEVSPQATCKVKSLSKRHFASSEFH